jgi:hypothetical protein
MKALAAVVILATPLCVGNAQPSPPTTNAITAPGLLYLISHANLLSISNAVKIASALQVGMAKAEVDKYLQAHGMKQTNIYSMSLDRGRTLTCPYPLAGAGTSLMLEMQCSQVRSGLFGWGAK